MSSRLVPSPLSDVSPSAALATAEALAATGSFLDAIDVLNGANRTRRDPEIERRLVQLRHQAFDELVAQPPPAPSPRPSTGELPRVTDGIPTVVPHELTPELLRSGISSAGCVRVPALVPKPTVDRLIEDIDRAIEGYDAHAAGAPVSDTTPWFEPFAPAQRYRAGAKIGGKRASVRSGGGAWLVDSPRALYDLVDTFDDVGLAPVITGFLGERPALSMAKCTLRRVPLDTVGAAWHQDGAFLGKPIRTLNVWIALTHAGRDAPGLDILPRRLEYIVATGTEGAIFPWSVAPAMVEAASEGTAVCRPIFEPGDALLFDELFLHRTACEPEMTRERYAIETWLFAPSVYPGKQIPLVF
ncbi:MAG: phytanoyl-CoA dioxygenase family protein [Acidimicrobiia bacterium]